jgi:hypothetical protein
VAPQPPGSFPTRPRPRPHPRPRRLDSSPRVDQVAGASADRTSGSGPASEPPGPEHPRNDQVSNRHFSQHPES